MKTVFVAVVTALVTSLAHNLLIGPRLEARNRRIQEAHKTRDRFVGNVFDLLSYATRLLNAEVPAEASTVVAQSLQAERTRWLDKIGETTKYLIDDGMQGSLTYPLWMRDLAGAFSVCSRMVWLSQRPERVKVQLLADMSEHAHGLYGTAWWRRPWDKPRHIVALRQLLDDTTEDRR